jgi:energy-coupling factor transport system ATP-binding protein
MPTVFTTDPFEFRYQGSNTLFSSPQPLAVQRRELVTLIGDNGSGKSSLLKAIAGIQSNVYPLPMKVFGQRPKAGVFGQQLGLLMQRPNRQLFEATVEEELSFSLRRFGLPIDMASELLEQLGLAALAQRSPHTLSYGQQHLVALASLACYRPSLLLLDDPLAGLDSAHLDKLWMMINSLRKDGCSVIISCHRSLPLAATQEWQLVKGELLVNNMCRENRRVG